MKAELESMRSKVNFTVKFVDIQTLRLKMFEDSDNYEMLFWYS